jgi:hypothetical protein
MERAEALLTRSSCCDRNQEIVRNHAAPCGGYKELSGAIYITNRALRFKWAESLCHVSCSLTLSYIKVSSNSRVPPVIKCSRASG